MTIDLDPGHIRIKNTLGQTVVDTGDALLHGALPGWNITGAVLYPTISSGGSPIYAEQSVDLGAAPPGHTQVFGAVKFDLNNNAAGQAFDRWTMVMGGSIVWVMDGEPGFAMAAGDNSGRYQHVDYHFRIVAGRVEIVRTVFLRDTPATYQVLSHTITYKLRTGNWN